MKKIYTLPLLLLGIILFFYSQAKAESLENKNYQLQIGAPTQQDPEPQSGTVNIITPPEIKPAEIDERVIKGDNYIVELSYDDDKKHIPFSFSLSSDSIHFGDIEAGDPLLRTQSISVSPGSARGFQMLAQQDHPLTNSSGTQIPNTSCDSGSCTDILSDSWELPLTYGFGYTCRNVNSSSCSPTFGGNLYKRFSTGLFNEQPSQILYSSEGKKSESVMEYKLNIPSTQAKGSYSAIINYIFVPNL